MAVTRLLHIIPESGICKNQRSHQLVKYSVRKDTLHISVDRIPLLTTDHNLLARNLSHCVRRPICSTRYRYNALRCCCSLLPDSNTTTPCMKAAAAAMTGPNSPYIANLVMAVGAVVFVLWGLQPLVRTTRNILSNKDDTSWKRSTTHYVLTSYLQPVLLWGGAMLVCRALDPVVMPTKASRLIKQRVVTFVRSLSTILTFAYCLSCAVQRAHTVFVETNEHSDAGSMGFHLAGKAVYTSVWIAAVSLFMELLGFSTKKWLTAGGLGTVLLTLAGREIFTNFLSSVIIQTTRPFVANEWIQTRIEGYEVSGTVEDVGWWSPTVIRGEDREAVYIPNHKFTVNIVRNLSQKNHWRIRANLAISHLDVNKINTIVADMRKVLAKSPQVEQQKLHRRVFLDTINPDNQALTILVSCFVKTSHQEEYLCVKEAILLDLLRVISHHGARLATPIRTIQKHYSDPDIDNIPFSESVFSREMAPSRPFFLIEPSYKINGEDYAKARIARSGGGPDSQAAGQESASDSTADGKSKGTSDSQSEMGEAIKSASQSRTEETFKSGIAALDHHSKASRKQPTTDSKTDTYKLKDKSASQSRTEETFKSGIAALDHHSKASRQQPTTDSKTDTYKLKDKSASQSTSGLKADVKLKGTSGSQSRTGDTSKSASANNGQEESKGLPTSSAYAIKVEIKQPDTSSNPYEKTSSGDNQKSVETAETPVSSSEGSDRQSSKASPSNQTEKPWHGQPKAAVEENIVLEVALDGLKRSLPVDEYRPATSATPTEAKEVATNRNSNEKGAVKKDDKDE